MEGRQRVLPPESADLTGKNFSPVLLCMQGGGEFFVSGAQRTALRAFVVRQFSCKLSSGSLKKFAFWCIMLIFMKYLKACSLAKKKYFLTSRFFLWFASFLIKP
ncbi:MULTISPECIES: hypothetical protein [unclassified Desulfovibrio]|uniref:hypothetical protein n=1 Tax=unclassified Desulfovibrio TaxID=2593640 RepID=UPI000F5EA5A8|nr:MULTISPECIES: hypothetical protein [unclassified Desulfovibrio]RRD71609.1 hypothetical protein EII24_03060 [Desulfovibrio sp. OH1209_COT-279]RRD87854.1 hypothetical protein EII23_03060 [Desulfovibrio sp. OH1186_COT-070]